MAKQKHFTALNLDDLQCTAKDGHGRPMNRRMVQVKFIMARDLQTAKTIASMGNDFTWAVVPKKVIDNGIVRAIA